MNLLFLLLDTRNHVEKLIWTRDFLSKFVILMKSTHWSKADRPTHKFGNEENGDVNQRDRLYYKKEQKLNKQKNKKSKLSDFLSQFLFGGLKEVPGLSGPEPCSAPAGWTVGSVLTWWSQGPAFGPHKPTSFRQHRNVPGNKTFPFPFHHVSIRHETPAGHSLDARFCWFLSVGREYLSLGR